jgi:hypothetical protein
MRFGKCFFSIWDKELSGQWNESIIVPLYKKGDKTDRTNCRGISLRNCIQNVIQNPSVKVNSIR